MGVEFPCILGWFRGGGFANGFLSFFISVVGEYGGQKDAGLGMDHGVVVSR